MKKTKKGEIFINRNRNILLILIGTLILIVGILTYINRSQITLSDSSGEKLTLKAQGKVITTLNKKTITRMQAENFSAVLHGGGRPAEKHNYRGISIKKLLEKQDTNILKGKKQVIMKGIDGYVVSFSIDEIEDEKNIYLVYQEDGKTLKNKKQGGEGPYMIVACKDAFGQRWCKYLSEVEVK